MRFKGFIGVGLCLIVGVLAPPAMAHGSTSTSLNWSGYAVHRSGVKFRRVSGEWRIPTGACLPGSQGFSAFWIGLGGYRLSSRALEQVGTEFDCTPSGRAELSAWYELVPAPVRRIHMRVSPGDLIRAHVHVRAHRVSVWLKDVTTGRVFHRILTDRHTDVTSAEWIAEAPSECLGGLGGCSVLPLADFGSIRFTQATVESTKYRWGGIVNRRWNTSRILLANTDGRRYVSGRSPSARATPSALTGAGRSFTVTYQGTPATIPGTGASVASVWVRPPARPLARQSG